MPSHTNTLLAEPCNREGRLIALAQEVVPPAANPIQLTNRLWLRPGAAMVGHLSPFPRRLLPEDSEEHSSTAKGATRGTGTEGAALCQEKAPADGPDHLRGQRGQGRQSPRTHLYIVGARDTRVLCPISSLMSIMHKSQR